MRAFVSPLVEIDNSNNSSALIAQLIALYCSRIAVICLEASSGGRPTFVCIRKTTIVIGLGLVQTAHSQMLPKSLRAHGRKLGPCLPRPEATG